MKTVNIFRLMPKGLLKEKNMWYNTVSPYSYHDNNANLNLDKFFDAWHGASLANQTYSSKEEGDKLFLSVDLPGAKSSDVKIESVVGQVKIFGKQKGKDFRQTYSLPKTYDPATGLAKLEDGILTLTFDKFKTSKSSVTSIEVK